MNQAIWITLGFGGTKTQIEADVIGIWAVHPVHDAWSEGHWTVTHVPTGIGVCVLEKDEAYAIARKLDYYGVDGEIYGAEPSPYPGIPQAKADPDFRHQVEAVVAEAISFTGEGT